MNNINVFMTYENIKNKRVGKREGERERKTDRDREKERETEEREREREREKEIGVDTKDIRTVCWLSSPGNGR